MKKEKITYTLEQKRRESMNKKRNIKRDNKFECDELHLSNVLFI